MPRNVTEWQQNVLGQPNHVDESITTGKDFSSSATIVIAARKGERPEPTHRAGYYKLDANGPANWETIGVVQNASVAQNKQLAQIFEIGSNESYFVPGRTVVQATISRVMIDGNSLMKVMYPLDTELSVGEHGDMGFATQGDDGVVSAFYINLASDFFNNSLDLGFFFYDGESEPIGAFYLKDAHIQAHQITLASQQTVVLENISLRASQVIGFNAP